MILPVIVVLFGAAMAGLYWYLLSRPDRPTLVRTALFIGVGIGVIRAAGACAGWYVVEHTGGPLQVPGFALAMLAWPEAAIFRERSTTPATAQFYLQLALLLISSSVAIVAIVAAAASRRISRRHVRG